jgi:hypothetical protein
VIDYRELNNPFKLKAFLWPDVVFYKEQRHIIESSWENDETDVPAGNMLGKDFTAGFIALAFFLTRSPCRVVTTSVDHTQLVGVLWGEIRRYLQTSRVPLDFRRGGPLIVNHLHIRKIVGGKVCGLSYLLGRVAASGEGMLGHHIAATNDGVPRTMFIADEASGVDDLSYERADTWARRKLIIGNCFPCNNFFKRNCKAGDVLRPDGLPGYYRKVIKIKCSDSPNVRYAMEEIACGLKPSNRIIIPGVMPYADYLKRRTTWDLAMQSVGLDAEWYEGNELLLLPPDWLNASERFALSLRPPYIAKAAGMDPAEGGDDSVWTVIGEKMLIDQIAKKTPDTNVIPRESLALIRKFGFPAENFVFDRGGGLAHADSLRADGFNVRTAAFGGNLELDIRHGRYPVTTRREFREEKYAFKNKRSQMYWMLREVLQPNERGESTFGIPPRFTELRRQLSVIPLTYDNEGRFLLIPKRHPAGSKLTTPTLQGLLGRSPDHADSFALAVYGLLTKPLIRKAGVA